VAAGAEAGVDIEGDTGEGAGDVSFVFPNETGFIVVGSMIGRMLTFLGGVVP